MRLYKFEINGQSRVGLEWQEQLVDVATAYSAFVSGAEPKPGRLRAVPTELLSFIRLGTLALEAAADALAFVKKRPAVPVGEQLVYPFETVKILTPIPRPGKILCAGTNYLAHKEENPAAVIPAEPFFFAKLPSTVIGPGAAIVKPALTEQLDYEVELAVVIGKRMKRTPESEVMDSIFGYTLINDVSARDVQFKDNQITLGKNFDTFCPLGPCIVTADELTQPGSVRLRTRLNGVVMQEGVTADWIFPLPKLLSFLSQVMTLEPGDVVSTGTPEGAGVFRNPPVFMKPGDVVAIEAEGIGRLENPVIAEENP